MTFGYAVYNKDDKWLNRHGKFAPLPKGWTPFIHHGATLKLGGPWLGEDGGESLLAIPGAFDEGKNHSVDTHPELTLSVKSLLEILNQQPVQLPEERAEAIIG